MSYVRMSLIAYVISVSDVGVGIGLHNGVRYVMSVMLQWCQMWECPRSIWCHK